MTAPFAIRDKNHTTLVGRTLLDHYNALLNYYGGHGDPEFSDDLDALLTETCGIVGMILADSFDDPDHAIAVAEATMRSAAEFRLLDKSPARNAQ